MATQWFVQDGPKVTGPLTPAEFKAAAASGAITPASLVRREGDPQWFAASAVKGLFEASSVAAQNPIAAGRPAPAGGQPAAPPAANPFVASPPVAPMRPIGAPSASANAPAAISGSAAPTAGGSLLDTFNGNPALQFGVAAAVAGTVTFVLAMGALTLFRGSSPASQEPPPTLAAVDPETSRPPAVAEASSTSKPTPKPAEASIAAAVPEATDQPAVSVEPAIATPTAMDEPKAEQAPSPVNPRDATEPTDSADSPGDEEPLPANAANSSGAGDRANNVGEMKSPAGSAANDESSSSPAPAAPAGPPKREESKTPPKEAAPARSLAELVAPEAGTQQTSVFGARMKRLTEIHTLHANSLKEWRELENRRAPLASKLQELVPSIQGLQSSVAQWQAELQLCQTEYAQATAAYNRASDQAAKSAAQRNGTIWQNRGATAQARITEYSQRLVREQQVYAATEKQLADVVQRSAKLIAGVDDTAPTWMGLCDPFRKLSAGERDALRQQLGRWIQQEPELAYTYLGRAFLEMGEPGANPAVELDLNEAERLDPRLAVATKPIRGYVRARGADAKQGLAMLNEVTRDAGKAALPFLLRGRVLLEQGEYGRAEGDFEKATRFDDKMADGFESLAYLLACCPQGSVLAGKRAVTMATKACELTNWQDWRCLDVLAAASAEAGDFETAEKHVRAAIQLAAPDFTPDLEARLKLYQQQTPYRFPAVERSDR